MHHTAKTFQKCCAFGLHVTLLSAPPGTSTLVAWDFVVSGEGTRLIDRLNSYAFSLWCKGVKL